MQLSPLKQKSFPYEMRAIFGKKSLVDETQFNTAVYGAMFVLIFSTLSSKLPERQNTLTQKKSSIMTGWFHCIAHNKLLIPCSGPNTMQFFYDNLLISMRLLTHHLIGIHLNNLISGL